MNSIWHNTVLSDNSDYCDSEVEFQLYSQLHYQEEKSLSPLSCTINVSSNDNNSVDQALPSICCKSFEPIENVNTNDSDAIKLNKRQRTSSECSDVIEDWEIIKSDSNSDCSDNCLDDDKLWTVSLKDQHRSDVRILRYYHKLEPPLKCRICNKPGHKAYQCRKAQLSTCHLCGDYSHANQKCKTSNLLGVCYNRNFTCLRCGQVGHSKAYCPDLWRQYHLTTKPGKIQISKIKKLMEKRSCHYCGRASHFAHECLHNTHDEVAASPTIFRYDKFNKKFKANVRNTDYTEKNKNKVVACSSFRFESKINFDNESINFNVEASPNPNWFSFHEQSSNLQKKRTSSSKKISINDKISESTEDTISTSNNDKPKSVKKLCKKIKKVKTKLSKAKSLKKLNVENRLVAFTTNIKDLSESFENCSDVVAKESDFCNTSKKEPSKSINSFRQASKKKVGSKKNSKKLNSSLPDLSETETATFSASKCSKKRSIFTHRKGSKKKHITSRRSLSVDDCTDLPIPHVPKVSKKKLKIHKKNSKTCGNMVLKNQKVPQKKHVDNHDFHDLYKNSKKNTFLNVLYHQKLI